MSLGEGQLLAGAYAGGIECSLRDLMPIWGMGSEELNQLLQVQQRIEHLNLILVPGPESGSIDSPRVLRAPRVDTLADRLPTLAEAENGRTEFKESLFADMRRFRETNQLVENPAVTKAALKSVAAFMNAQGGTLLLGVDDSGSACDGIAQDCALKRCDQDRLELKFRELLTTRFVGVDAESHISLEWADCKGNPVIGIHVVSSRKPCFLRAEKDFEFFIRRGNRTVQLGLLAFYEHIVAASEQSTGWPG